MRRGRSRRGKPTPIWVFVLHLSVVFTATWGAMLAFSSGHRVIGVCLAGVWVVAFVITALDDVRVRAFEWTYVYVMRSEEHTSELQSLMRISYAVFCLKKKNII